MIPDLDLALLKTFAAIVDEGGLTARSAKSRALRALERAGLIKVARHPGRFPTVTLLCTGRSRKQ